MLKSQYIIRHYLSYFIKTFLHGNRFTQIGLKKNLRPAQPRWYQFKKWAHSPIVSNATVIDTAHTLFNLTHIDHIRTLRGKSYEDIVAITMPDHPAQLIACHECDLLHREIDLPTGGEAHCRRCGAMLYRSSPGTFDNTLAFALAAAVLFVLANVYPLLGIEMKGNPNVTNLFGAAHYLWHHDMRLISTLVGITAIIIPALEIALMIYLLLPLRFHYIPAGIPLIMRLLQGIRPWGMVEVFMLGILVSIVKLRDTSTILPGVALWSFAGLTLMLAAIASSFNPRDIWMRMDQGSALEKRHE